MSTAHWQARRPPIPAARPVRSSPAARPWAIISAGLAPILLTGAYLMAGLLQPASDLERARCTLLDSITALTRSLDDSNTPATYVRSAACPDQVELRKDDPAVPSGGRAVSRPWTTTG